MSGASKACCSFRREVRLRARPRTRRDRLHQGAFGVLLTLAVTGRAAGPLGANGSAVRTSSYAVDLTQTPVLAGSRVTGLAGAYVAIAEGTDGDIQTPVAPAIHTAYSLDHFDYQLGLGITLPATLTSTDFFNTGHNHTQLSDSNQKGVVFVTPALNLTWGRFGLGGTVELQNYSLSREDVTAATRSDRLSAAFTVAHIQAASLFAKDQLAIGAGLRILSLGVSNQGAAIGSRALFSGTGTGFELGALFMPDGMPFRVGAAFRSAVSTVPDPQSQLAPNAENDRVYGDPADPVNAIWLPDRIEQPWDLNVGVAVQLGPRPFNVRFRDPKIPTDEARWESARRRAARRAHRQRLLEQLHAGAAPDDAVREGIDAELDGDDAFDELHVERVAHDARAALKHREARLPRRHLLISSSLVVIGRTTESVGIESFLQRVVLRSGEHLVFSPRLGLETELLPRWVKVRAGTYGEPSRFATSGNRWHGTFGFDAKLFPWEVFGLFDEGTDWLLSSSIDAAPRYLGWGVSVGVWH
ncbi:MAG TPA: hypothetical protein VF395_07790 [Polyangiaceae bacterium]